MSETFPVATLRAFSNGVFTAAGLAPEDAATVTDCLIHADLRGKEVKLGATPDKVHVFRNGRSLLYR